MNIYLCRLVINLVKSIKSSIIILFFYILLNIIHLHNNFFCNIKYDITYHK